MAAVTLRVHMVQCYAESQPLILVLLPRLIRTCTDVPVPRPGASLLFNLFLHPTLAESLIHKKSQPFPLNMMSNGLDLVPAISDSDISEKFVYIHDIATGDHASFAASSYDRAEFSRHAPSAQSSLIFLRGLPSPQWLNVFGEIYDSSAELYRRHLAFQFPTPGGRDYIASPPLCSASARIFQLAIPTICTRNVGLSGNEMEDLQQVRARESDAMAKYFQALQNNGNVADSVVRQCSKISNQEYFMILVAFFCLPKLGDTQPRNIVVIARVFC
ncbi:hypothetical protein BCR34DRAFT_582988 [Clohesyomyces aquaticus]|uniref:Uncharacterized protein n=1 Tax=Clohesyomyces aquaticus TaxID=1231657 RepID=A0A1Y2A782_9PLEO|nr:hypothetical protein BCR34DRAFT_582988 [Clohesyomyces aquaticus]